MRRFLFRLGVDLLVAVRSGRDGAKPEGGAVREEPVNVYVSTWPANTDKHVPPG